LTVYGTRSPAWSTLAKLLTYNQIYLLFWCLCSPLRSYASDLVCGSWSNVHQILNALAFL
jgi:hypothetical protein